MPLQDPGAAAADESNATKTATTATAAAPVASTRTRLREKRLTINQNSSDGRDQHANWHQIEKTPAPGTRRPVPSVPEWYPAPRIRWPPAVGDPPPSVRGRRSDQVPDQNHDPTGARPVAA